MCVYILSHLEFAARYFIGEKREFSLQHVRSQVSIRLRQLKEKGEKKPIWAWKERRRKWDGTCLI